MIAPEFAPIFTDNAVLQCGMPTRIWGRGNPGGEVSVAIDGQVFASARCDAAGKWATILPERPSGGPHTLALRFEAGETSVRDIWFGEVWVASGQSNMEWQLPMTEEWKEVEASPNSNVRMLRVPGFLEPRDSPPDMTWTCAGDPGFEQSSAVGYHFADRLQREIGGVVGVISCAYGGSKIEAWLPDRVFESEPALRHLRGTREAAQALNRSPAEWQAEMDRYASWYQDMVAWNNLGEPRNSPPPEEPPLHSGNPCCQSSPSILYRSMLEWVRPVSSRGLLWYQGESNTDRPELYATLFRRLIETWRKEWEIPQWPVYFVQLPAHHGLGDWAGLRAAQVVVRDSVPMTGMAVALDCGDRLDIHPPRKRPVGDRLARLALRDTYGRPVVASGPVLERAHFSPRSVELVFSDGGGGSLRTFPDNTPILGFEVLDSGGRIHSAAASLNGPRSIVVTIPREVDPVEIRYAWSNWTEANMRNEAGLPAEPFLLID